MSKNQPSVWAAAGSAREEYPLIFSPRLAYTQISPLRNLTPKKRDMNGPLQYGIFCMVFYSLFFVYISMVQNNKVLWNSLIRNGTWIRFSRFLRGEIWVYSTYEYRYCSIPVRTYCSDDGYFMTVARYRCSYSVTSTYCTEYCKTTVDTQKIL